jgi:hypothetical protein
MMLRSRYALVPLIFLFVLTGTLQSQQKEPKTTRVQSAKDVDPLALRVLQAVAQPVEQAQAFKLQALVSEEELASDEQIVTFFHTIDIAVQRPDKVHLVFRGRGQRVDFYTANGVTTMYAPDTKLYTTMPSKPTIDEMVANLRAKDIDVPVGPFLTTNFYDTAAKAVITGYVVGRVKLFDQDVHQLAFTAPDADWQLWVTGGDEPRFVRAEIVNKKLQGKPRTIIQFLNWDLNPTFSADEFVFTKPDDAVEIGMLPAPGGK